MFKSRNQYLKSNLENGDSVIARASISLYEGRGEFQLIVEHLEPAGEGLLQKTFEELKQKLSKEGLFDEKHKKKLSDFPKSIGVITSPTGAAIRDILTVIKRRYSPAKIIIYPVPVQGSGSADVIAQTIQMADERAEIELIILARGGGSLEDLWSFNDENVARAIHQCQLPVVTGIGHEIDFTIADFVADKRAPTPSAAAELVTPDKVELHKQVTSIYTKLLTQIRQKLQSHSQTLLHLEKRLPHPIRQLQSINQRIDDISMCIQQSTKLTISEKKSTLAKLSLRVNQNNPVHKLQSYREKCQYLEDHLRREVSDTIRKAEATLAQLSNTLHTTSPLATMSRGYAIVTKVDNDEIIRNAASLSVDASIKIRLAKGQVLSTVKEVIKDE